MDFVATDDPAVDLAARTAISSLERPNDEFNIGFVIFPNRPQLTSPAPCRCSTGCRTRKSASSQMSEAVPAMRPELLPTTTFEDCANWMSICVPGGRSVSRSRPGNCDRPASCASRRPGDRPRLHRRSCSGSTCSKRPARDDARRYRSAGAGRRQLRAGARRDGRERGHGRRGGVGHRLRPPHRRRDRRHGRCVRDRV